MNPTAGRNAYERKNVRDLCASHSLAQALYPCLFEFEVQSDVGGTKKIPCTEESACLPFIPPKSHSFDAAAINIIPLRPVGAGPWAVPPRPNQTASHVVEASVNLKTSVAWSLTSGQGGTVSLKSVLGQFQVCLSLVPMNPAARITLPCRQINSIKHQYRKRGSTIC